MVRRIVKMTFQPDHCAGFEAIFEESKDRIRAFPGCHHLELWRCRQPGNVYMTYSHWTDEAALESYRHSELFKTTWAKTKRLFAGKPEAWSLDVQSVPHS